MVFKPIKEINRLRNEIKRLLRKGMLDFLSLKSSPPGHVLGELQLTQLSWNFQTYCYNLKIRGLGAKLGVAFLLFLLCGFSIVFILK